MRQSIGIMQSIVVWKRPTILARFVEQPLTATTRQPSRSRGVVRLLQPRIRTHCCIMSYSRNNCNTATCTRNRAIQQHQKQFRWFCAAAPPERDISHPVDPVTSPEQDHNDNTKLREEDDDTTSRHTRIKSEDRRWDSATTATTAKKQKRHQRVWKVVRNDDNDDILPDNNDDYGPNNTVVKEYWVDRIIDQQQKQRQQNSTNGGGGGIDAIQALIARVQSQRAKQGDGRMRQTQLGVLHADPTTDLQMLVNNYTVKAVASALRDREDALQQAATLAADGKLDELQSFLQIFHPRYVLERRRMQKQTKSYLRFNNDIDGQQSIEPNSSSTVVLDDPISTLHTDASRQVIRKALMRMPRTITSAYTKRAGVCLALCLSNGVPSMLLEKRASHLNSHPDEVCLPGGMVCDVQDQTIVSTSIREMKEEIGGLDDENNYPIEIIGILRLNWGEVHHLTGIAVTPVVCYLGELPETLYPNPEEVAEVFTIPLADLLDTSLWVHKDGLAPIFVGGPHVIWGLTGYILERLAIELRRLSTA